jgi:hypothetical protein
MGGDAQTQEALRIRLMLSYVSIANCILTWNQFICEQGSSCLMFGI